ncbi:ribonuclease H [Senna tora]|uniref:Ribonuclease H n=1 Tax=Senna tora TaxID=362788 RepID=A0A834W2X4_9FABA|nr:ribonuclease H [Senna tora]
MAGRATLIQSVTSTMPLYHMQHSMLPKGTINRIEKLERAFLWGSTPGRRNAHQISWNKICMPKHLGGGKYGIENLNQDMGKSMPNDSRLWKDLNKIWSEFSQLTFWEIGNGSSTSFWNSRWLPLSQVLSELVEPNAISSIRNEVIREFTTEHAQWNTQKLRSVLPIEIVNKITESCPPAPDCGQDVIRWLPGKDGCFSTKSVYYAIRNLNQSVNNSQWSSIWKGNMLYRNKFFLWRLRHESLPTRSRIAQWSSSNLLWRNKKLHAEEFTFPNDPIKTITCLAQIQMEAWGSVEPSSPNSTHLALLSWPKLKEGWININTDGAVCRRTMIAGCGGFVRDHEGQWIQGFTFKIRLASPLCAELWGLSIGLQRAWELGFRRII